MAPPVVLLLVLQLYLWPLTFNLCINEISNSITAEIPFNINIYKLKRFNKKSNVVGLVHTSPVLFFMTSMSPLRGVFCACVAWKESCRGRIVSCWKMPSDHDKGAYPEPPRQTPASDKQTALPNPALILSKLFYYSVDLPVTTFRGKGS